MTCPAWVLLREKGGKGHVMLRHHYLAVPHDRSRRGSPTQMDAPAPGECLYDDWPARGRGRHRHQARQSQLPGLTGITAYL